MTTSPERHANRIVIPFCLHAAARRNGGREISPLHVVLPGRQMVRRARWLTAEVAKVDPAANTHHYVCRGGKRSAWTCMGVRERKAREKQDLRQQILEAARELFVREGVESTSIRKIAQRIEYAPGTIYLYFKDKSEILQTLCEETFSRLHLRMQASKDDRGNTLDSLRRGLRASIEFGLHNPHHYLVTFVLAHPALDEIRKRNQQDPVCRYCDNLRGIVRKCIQEGLFRLHDVEETRQALWAGIHGITTLLITKKGFPFVEQTRLVDRVVEVLVEGVRRTRACF